MEERRDSLLKSFLNNTKSAWNQGKVFLVGYYRQSKFYRSFEETRKELSGYWSLYGGWRAIVTSPAFWLSCILTLVCSPLWWEATWADTPLSVLPNLLGFSLGSMAIIMAFPSSRNFKIFAEGGRPDSYYLDLASKFVHFIIIQVAAIISALVLKTYPYALISGVVFVLFVYAILTAVMTALALFGVAQVYNHPGSANSE